MNLTIAYVTSRKEPCFEWFAHSLNRETDGNFDGIRVIVVDYWAQTLTHLDWTFSECLFRCSELYLPLRFQMNGVPNALVVTPPKPTPWQGPFRLTKNDYFAPSNARNTALCFAHDGWIAYVDDLSVLMPGWLAAVREAIAENRITCGAFRKVNKLVVEKGNVISYEDHPAGVDSRWSFGDDTKAVECYPNWTFGCSIVAPVEKFLELNGWPEMADSGGLGGEDTALGIAWANRGEKIYYDRRMLTFESEERHHNQPTMLRLDKRLGGEAEFAPGIKTKNEKGHMMVVNLRKAKRFTNYFEDGGIRALRQQLLSGKPFPIVLQPRHCFFDGQPIEEF